MYVVLFFSVKFSEIQKKCVSTKSMDNFGTHIHRGKAKSGPMMSCPIKTAELRIKPIEKH